MEFTEVNELANFAYCSQNPTSLEKLRDVPVSLKYFDEEPIYRILAYSPKYQKNSLEPGSKEMSEEGNFTPLSYSLGSESQKKKVNVKKEQTQHFDIQPQTTLTEVQSREETVEEFALGIVLRIVNKICGNPVEHVSPFPKTLPRGSLGDSTMTKMMTKASEARSIAGSYLFKPVRRKGPNCATLEIFLMETSKAIYLNVQQNDTIDQIIKQILYVCKQQKVYNGEIQFPFDSPAGYELRLVDDDQPIYELPAIKRNMQFCDCGLESVALCVNNDYESPEKPCIKSRKEANEIHMRKIVQMHNKVLLRIHLYIPNDNSSLAITADSSETLDSIFRKIAQKRKIICAPHYFQFLPFHPNLNTEYSAIRLLNYMDECNLNVINMNVPIKELKSRELVLTEKIFVDLPGNKRRLLSVAKETSIEPRVIQAQLDQALLSSREAEQDIQEEDLLLNDISATTYKEYEVHKTNEYGIKQARVLALDHYYLFNEKPKNKNQYFGSFLPSLFKKIATTKKSMVLISDIHYVIYKKTAPKNFCISYFDKSGTIQLLDYEAKTAKDAVEIVARIKYVRNMLKKERSSVLS